MAPRKKPQKPSDETPDARAEETQVAVAGDDSLNAEAQDTVPDTDALAVEPEAPAAPDTVESAEAGAEPVAEPAPEPEADSIELPEPDSADHTDTLPAAEDTLSEEQEAEPETAAEAEPEAEAEEMPPSDAPMAPETSHEPAPTREVVVEKRGGAVPLIIGGIIAGVIGYGAALATGGQLPGMGGGTTSRIDAQDQAIADLKASIPAAPDLAPLEQTAKDNAATLAELSDRVGALSGQLTELQSRVTEVEKAPLENGISEAAKQAYEAELTRVQDALRQQREEVEKIVANAQQMKADATAQTTETEARAALTQIIAALESGEGYADPLATLQSTGHKVPAPLEKNVDGIATLAELRAAFPPAARDALATSRGAGNSSIGDFFKTQLGIRSLEPKVGSDPDAILSRAEAALANSDLKTALTEIEALPPEAQAAFDDWKAQAETRLTTVEAANGLMAELNN